MHKIHYEDIHKIWVMIGGRGFAVMLVASIALFLGKLDGASYVAVAGLYLASNVTKKLIDKKSGD